MAYGAMSTRAVNYKVLAADWNLISTNWTWIASLTQNGAAISGLANSAELLPKWGARAYNSATISHTSSGGWINMTFDTETFDTDNIHSTSVNTGRFTAARAGKYLAHGSVFWASNGTGQRGIRVKLNGTTWCEHFTVPGSITVSVATVIEMTANQYVEFDGFQSSGGTLAMTNNGNFGIMGSLCWIGA